MDYQLLFNIAVGLAAFAGGWILNSISKAIERLDTDVRQMPVNYVSKADYRDDIAEVKQSLIRILEKLDAKADK